MDYEKLLAKYIAYVVDREGVDFISDGYFGHPGDTTFTKEEWAALVVLASEGKDD